MTEKQIRTLLQSSESEWLEFKKDNTDPQEIGKNISAISNSIVLLERNRGYIVWGLDSESNLKGTKFQPKTFKVGNEEIENWLLTQLKPQVNFTIHEKIIDERRVVIFEILSVQKETIIF